MRSSRVSSFMTAEINGPLAAGTITLGLSFCDDPAGCDPVDCDPVDCAKTGALASKTSPIPTKLWILLLTDK